MSDDVSKERKNPRGGSDTCARGIDRGTTIVRTEETSLVLGSNWFCHGCCDNTWFPNLHNRLDHDGAMAVVR